MFLPLIFLYISNIKIPSMPIKTPPIKEIMGTKDRNPSKKRINGRQQTIIIEWLFLMPMSYIKTFFNIMAYDKKPLKVITAPTKRQKEKIHPPKTFFNPVKAESVVWLPVMPRTKSTNKK